MSEALNGLKLKRGEMVKERREFARESDVLGFWEDKWEDLDTTCKKPIILWYKINITRMHGAMSVHFLTTVRPRIA